MSKIDNLVIATQPQKGEWREATRGVADKINKAKSRGGNASVWEEWREATRGVVAAESIGDR